MNYDEFSKKLEQTVTSGDLTDTTGDFQCDQTGGYPTCLCVCWTKGVAWLMLRYDLADDGADLSEFEQGVADKLITAELPLDKVEYAMQQHIAGNAIKFLIKPFNS